jgi:hypothetical protein
MNDQLAFRWRNRFGFAQIQLGSDLVDLASLDSHYNVSPFKPYHVTSILNPVHSPRIRSRSRNGSRHSAFIPEHYLCSTWCWHGKGKCLPYSLLTTFKRSYHADTTPFRLYQYEYSRSSNPNRNALETVLSGLERGAASAAEGGSVVFSSGSAATAAICQWLVLPAVEGGGKEERDGDQRGRVLSISDVVSIPVCSPSVLGGSRLTNAMTNE